MNRHRPNDNLPSLTLSFFTPCPFKLTCNSSLISDSHRTLQLNCIIHCILPFISVSFSASRTQLPFMSRLSPAASPLHLSAPAPSHHPSPTLYLTYQHSTTPSNTLHTLRHPRSHQIDINQASHITYPSLSISHHPTAAFPFQTRDLQTSASTSLPSTPHLHFTITASNQLHLCFTTIAPSTIHHAQPT